MTNFKEATSVSIEGIMDSIQANYEDILYDDPLLARVCDKFLSTLTAINSLDHTYIRHMKILKTQILSTIAAIGQYQRVCADEERNAHELATTMNAYMKNELNKLSSRKLQV